MFSVWAFMFPSVDELDQMSIVQTLLSLSAPLFVDFMSYSSLVDSASNLLHHAGKPFKMERQRVTLNRLLIFPSFRVLSYPSCLTLLGPQTEQSTFLG